MASDRSEPLIRRLSRQAPLRGKNRGSPNSAKDSPYSGWPYPAIPCSIARGRPVTLVATTPASPCDSTRRGYDPLSNYKGRLSSDGVTQFGQGPVDGRRVRSLSDGTKGWPGGTTAQLSTLSSSASCGSGQQPHKTKPDQGDTGCRVPSPSPLGRRPLPDPRWSRRLRQSPSLTVAPGSSHRCRTVARGSDSHVDPRRAYLSVYLYLRYQESLLAG